MRVAQFGGVWLGFVWRLLAAAIFFSIAAAAQNEMKSAKEMKNAEQIITSETKSAGEKRGAFYRVLDKMLPAKNLRKEFICDERDEVQMRILSEYGAVFVTGAGVVSPPKCMFENAREVDRFQQGIFKAGAEIDGARIELQTVAMQEFLKARAEAAAENLSISPRGGTEAARRSFEDTLRLWKSRFEPACHYWLKQGRLSAAQIEKLKSLPINDQVREVLRLEKQGIYFNTFFDDSILYSVAAPGTSQHLSMLALDVAEFENENVRKILAKHGWFRTVQNDAPHFTFLGHRARKLTKMGLKKIKTKNGEFWIPDVE